MHEGTAALQPRHTDARATPHRTPIPKDPDSFAGWSDADVLQVLCGTHHFHKVGISGLSGQVTDGGMFLDPVCTFTRCQPFAFGVLRVALSEPSLNVQMHALEHTKCTICKLFNLSSLPLLTCGARMPIERPCWSRTPDFTSMSLNIFHASKTVCKRSVANVVHHLRQTCDFDTVLNIVDHITPACGSIIVLKCFLEFFDMCFVDHSHTLHLVVLKKSLLSITTVLVLRSHTRSVK